MESHHTNSEQSSHNILTLNERQVRYLSASIIALVLISFLTGYYWGKKRAYEDFLGYCENQAFGDKIAASLCLLYESPEDKESEAPETGDQSESSDTIEQEATLQEAAEEGVLATNLYYAQLAGFGSKRSAEQYEHRLKNRGIASHTAERTSTTARGVLRTWYQVVTDPMPYEELRHVVERLKKEDHLNGVILIEYRKDNERFES